MLRMKREKKEGKIERIKLDHFSMVIREGGGDTKRHGETQSPSWGEIPLTIYY